MQLRYNYRVYPGPGHRQALARAFGCVRVVINDGLRARQAAHAAGQPYLTDAQLSARLTAAKATPARAWLSEVSAVVCGGDVRPPSAVAIAGETGSHRGAA
jgi:putative transposase